MAIVIKMYGTTAGHIVLAATLLASVLSLVLSLRSKTWKKMALDTVIDGKVNTIDDKLKIGDVGKTVSRLAPAGKALFNNEFYEVHTQW